MKLKKIEKRIKNYVFNPVNESFFKNFFLFFQKLKYSFFWFSKSYSYSAQDVIIGHIFQNKKKGVYIDVGCNHPVKGNNTYSLYKKGWRGINIDLDPVSVNTFKYYRPDDINLNVLISKKKNNQIRYFGPRSGKNTIEEIFDKDDHQIISIENSTLNKIYLDSKYRGSEIDLLSIDTEGSELDVLNTIDFKIFRPKLICVEYIYGGRILELTKQDLDILVNSELYKFFIFNNYKLINWLNQDLFFFDKQS